jgi:hypothetical protein
MPNDTLSVGDVALDQTQGRPVHIVEATGQTAAEWSDANDYELCENYGNERCGAEPSDMVFEVVYCSNAKSRPSKTYAMPESRLMRIETEAADDGRPVADRIAIEVLAGVFRCHQENGLEHRDISTLMSEEFGPEIVDVARELADVDVTIGDGGSDD